MARKRKQISSNGPIDSQLQFPAERVLRLMRQLKSALELVEARTIGREELEAWTGRPAGTIGSWMDGVRMQQVEFLFSLLERLPEKLRQDLVGSTCRIQPMLTHPSLAHDAVAVSRLEELVRQSIGFTAIQGSEHGRLFVLNALGNSCRVLNFGQRSVTGLNGRPLPSWAPVPGVIQLSAHEPMRQQVQGLWSRIKKTKDGSLVLLYGVWSELSQVHSEVVQLAGRCHVIVVDSLAKAEQLSRHLSTPVHIVTVGSVRDDPQWLRVTVQRS